MAVRNNLKWLITGGCGFIGTSLIKKLVSEEGHFIRILDNLSVGTQKDLAAVCTFKEPNLNSLSSHLSLGGETFQIATNNETTLDGITEFL